LLPEVSQDMAGIWKRPPRRLATSKVQSNKLLDFYGA
jgi:hypothetical protein